MCHCQKKKKCGGFGLIISHSQYDIILHLYVKGPLVIVSGDGAPRVVELVSELQHYLPLVLPVLFSRSLLLSISLLLLHAHCLAWEGV